MNQNKGDILRKPKLNESDVIYHTQNSSHTPKSLKSLKCISLNARSVVNKIEEIQTIIKIENPDIFVCTETHLSKDILSNEIFPQTYIVIRKDRNRHGGGLLIAYKTHLSVTPRPDLETDCEILWCEVICHDNKSLFVGVFYRPPSSSLDVIKELNKSMSILSNHGKKARNVILTGDFNLPKLKWQDGHIVEIDNTDLTQNILTIIENNFLYQHISQTTRITDTTSSILDLLFTSDPSIVSNVNIIPGISDHEAIVFIINCTLKGKGCKPRMTYSYSKADFNKFRNDLENAPLTESLVKEDLESSWQSWKNIILNVVDKNVPHRKVTRKYHVPWIDKDVKRLFRKRRKFFEKAKKSNLQSDWNKFRKIRRDTKRLVKLKYKDYLQNNLCEDIKSNPKRFWNFVKSKKKVQNPIPCLKVNGITFTDDKEKVDTLNKQFESVFKDTNDGPFPPCEERNDVPAMSDIHCCVADVCKLLKSIDVNKAQGPDGLSPRVLKEGAEQLAPSLCQLFNMSLSKGELPIDWRRANVSPLLKKGNKEDPGNYRPISLTSITCKLLEKFVCKHLVDHFNLHNVLCDNQHGFREKRSCETQLIEAIHDWSSWMNSGYSVDIAYLDFAKAFDSVSHNLLERKLKMYGIQNSNLKWIMNFLKNRSQRVVLNGEYSNWVDVKSGVPQGTILGPIIFLCFINDISYNIDSTIRLYADDCILYRPIHSIEDCKLLQKDLENLDKWANSWLLDFNVNKCKIMQMSRKSSKPQYEYKLGGHKLINTKSEKYLGITINDTLNFNSHCNETYAKCSKIVAIIKRNFLNCPRSVFKTLYDSLIRPCLEYCCIAWDPYRVSHINIIERVQKRYLRMMFRDWETSYHELLEKSSFAKLEERRKYHRLVMFYKIINNMVNVGPIEKIIRAHRIGRNDHNMKMYVPFAKTDYFKNSFYIRTANEWNMLPSNVINSPSLSTFKISLKSCLHI